MTELSPPPFHHSLLPSPVDYSQGQGLAELRRIRSPEGRLDRTCAIGIEACDKMYKALDGRTDTLRERRALHETAVILKAAREHLPALQRLLLGQKMVMSFGDSRITLHMGPKGEILGDVEKPISGTHTAGFVTDAGSITIRPEAISIHNLVQSVDSRFGISETTTASNITLLATRPDLPHDDPQQWVAQIDTISRETYAQGGRETVQLWNASGEKRPGRARVEKDLRVRQLSYDSVQVIPPDEVHYVQEPQFRKK